MGLQMYICHMFLLVCYIIIMSSSVNERPQNSNAPSCEEYIPTAVDSLCLHLIFVTFFICWPIRASDQILDRVHVISCVASLLLRCKHLSYKISLAVRSEKRQLYLQANGLCKVLLVCVNLRSSLLTRKETK